MSLDQIHARLRRDAKLRRRIDRMVECAVAGGIILYALGERVAWSRYRISSTSSSQASYQRAFTDIERKGGTLLGVFMGSDPAELFERITTELFHAGLL